jgi:hypothetical protein
MKRSFYLLKFNFLLVIIEGKVFNVAIHTTLNLARKTLMRLRSFSKKKKNLYIIEFLSIIKYNNEKTINIHIF